MCTLQGMQPISLLILGSVFSDCIVFYGDYCYYSKYFRNCSVLHCVQHLCKVIHRHISSFTVDYHGLEWPSVL